MDSKPENIDEHLVDAGRGIPKRDSVSEEECETEENETLAERLRKAGC